MRSPSNEQEGILSEILRYGIQRLIDRAINAEAEEFLLKCRGIKDAQGRQGVVRNGYLKTRKIRTTFGEIEVRVPRIRNKTELEIRFNSRLIPKYSRRINSPKNHPLETYLRALLTDDPNKALSIILGTELEKLSLQTVEELQQLLTESYYNRLGAAILSGLYSTQIVFVTLHARSLKLTDTPAKIHYFKERLPHAIPLTMIRIPGSNPFFLGRYPVTQIQWRAVTSLPKVNLDLNPDVSWFSGLDWPVESISLDDAIEFCQRLRRHTGKKYRLPTEKEWEYGCRAGSTSRFHFGNLNNPNKKALYSLVQQLANVFVPNEYRPTYFFSDGYNSTKQRTTRRTNRVSNFPPNAYGLSDMHGNVWEWTTDGVLKGGSWASYPEDCSVTSRATFDSIPLFSSIGFRLYLSE